MFIPSSSYCLRFSPSFCSDNCSIFLSTRHRFPRFDPKVSSEAIPPSWFAPSLPLPIIPLRYYNNLDTNPRLSKLSQSRGTSYDGSGRPRLRRAAAARGAPFRAHLQLPPHPTPLQDSIRCWTRSVRGHDGNCVITGPAQAVELRCKRKTGVF